MPLSAIHIQASINGEVGVIGIRENTTVHSSHFHGTTADGGAQTQYRRRQCHYVTSSPLQYKAAREAEKLGSCVRLPTQHPYPTPCGRPWMHRLSARNVISSVLPTPHFSLHGCLLLLPAAHAISCPYIKCHVDQTRGTSDGHSHRRGLRFSKGQR